MSGLPHTGTNGVLEIEGETAGWLSMHTFAWNILDNLELWLQAPVRGVDVLVPQVAGLYEQPRYPTAATHHLPFVVSGETDAAGFPAPIASRITQLETSLAYLDAQIFATPSDPNSLRNARLTKPSGTVLTARIHCLGLTPVSHSDDGVIQGFTFDIDIPRPGRFT